MIKAYRTQGIIILRRHFGEADRLLTIFTKSQGKKVVLAKGIRRIHSRRAPHLELFSHVALVLHAGKTFDIVTEASTIESFMHVRQKLERISFMYIALELINKLTAEHEPSEVVFANLLEFLQILNHPGTTRHDAKYELNKFKAKLLVELGFSDNNQLIIADMDRFIESITETEIKSQKLLTKIQQVL